MVFHVYRLMQQAHQTPLSQYTVSDLTPPADFWSRLYVWLIFAEIGQDGHWHQTLGVQYKSPSPFDQIAEISLHATTRRDTFSSMGAEPWRSRNAVVKRFPRSERTIVQGRRGVGSRRWFVEGRRRRSKEDGSFQPDQAGFYGSDLARRSTDILDTRLMQ
jgi:hypothetical protein